MGWYYKKVNEPPPHVCRPPSYASGDEKEGDIWECDDPGCMNWWVVDEVSSRTQDGSVLFWREFSTHDTNPGRNVHT